jgi:hypothetical protein
LFKDGIQETLDQVNAYKEVIYGAKIGVRENFNNTSYIQDQLNMEDSVQECQIVKWTRYESQSLKTYMDGRIEKQKRDRLTDSKLILERLCSLEEDMEQKPPTPFVEAIPRPPTPQDFL